jgi:HlyD family secretion protein
MRLAKAMKDNSVFRKVSLDRLASPEQLDQLLPVADLRGWVSLSAVGALLLAVIVWSVVGSIPQNVTGTGILVKSGGILEVIPVAAGQITDVAVAVGDLVSEGQVVARMTQPEVAARLDEAKATLAELRARHQQTVKFGDSNLALGGEDLARQRAAAEQSLTSARSVVDWMARKIEIETPLVEQGLVLKQTLLENQEKLQGAVDRIGQAKSQLTQIAVKELEIKNQRQEQVATSQGKLAEAERNVDQLIRELQTKTQIVAPYTGRILEILTEQGRVVAAGEPIMRLDLAGRTVKGLEAIIFVPSGNGKQIQVGMPVLIAPTTVKQEEYGMMMATVTSVSDFPATIKGMQRVLKNEKLVDELSGTDTPYEIHADLVVDPNTVSQYRWSSSAGPPQRIRSGTLANANIAVSYRRPIQLVLPVLRGHSGL